MLLPRLLEAAPTAKKTLDRNAAHHLRDTVTTFLRRRMLKQNFLQTKLAGGRLNSNNRFAA
jgi:hypothetical protein